MRKLGKRLLKDLISTKDLTEVSTGLLTAKRKHEEGFIAYTLSFTPFEGDFYQ